MSRSKFSEQVIRWIKKIPKGKVATYGQIAKLAGKPHAARGVSWILHSCATSHQLPWQRVLGSKGTLSFPVGSADYRKQKKTLLKEGIHFHDGDRIDLSKFQWKPRTSPNSVSVGSRKRRPLPKIFGDS